MVAALQVAGGSSGIDLDVGIQDSAVYESAGLAAETGDGNESKESQFKLGAV